MSRFILIFSLSLRRAFQLHDLNVILFVSRVQCHFLVFISLFSVLPFLFWIWNAPNYIYLLLAGKKHTPTVVTTSDDDASNAKQMKLLNTNDLPICTEGEQMKLRQTNGKRMALTWFVPCFFFTFSIRRNSCKNIFAAHFNTQIMCCYWHNSRKKGTKSSCKLNPFTIWPHFFLSWIKFSNNKSARGHTSNSTRITLPVTLCRPNTKSHSHIWTAAAVTEKSIADFSLCEYCLKL